MAKSYMDGMQIPITCPNCGTETKKLIGWLKKNDSFTCSSCGLVVDLLEEDVRVALDAAEKSASDLSRHISRLNKRK